MTKLNIFGVVNHSGNQYEMLKLARKYPVKFHYLENNVRKWPNTYWASRPEPTTFLNEDQFEWVQAYEPGKYDLAILHTDQQHIDPGIGKGKLYRELNEVIQDIPKIVICHGTPMWPERFNEDVVINGGEVLTDKGPMQIVGMKQMIGANFMVVNSYEAVDRWGFGYPVIHGMEAHEWWDLPKEPRVNVQLSPGGLDTYYNRQLLTAIKARVKEKVGLDVFHTNINFHPKSWDHQRQFLGSSLILVNQTKDSPMPRSRTEAMFSGCCVLTSKYHDADKFIRHGENGFIVPDNPLSYAEAIYQLINFNYKEAIEIGQEGKKTAQKYFNWERYAEDIWFVISEIANGRRPKWDGSTIYG